MAKVAIIGGSGHVGTYLVPRLVEAGHHVVNVTRGHRQPYSPNAAWSRVETVILDRDAAEHQGSFGIAIAALEADIVIDMICFTLPRAQHLVAALRGKVQHFLHCGTIWVYGHNTAVPATEDQPLNPFGAYGTQKAAIETYLLDEARRSGFPATVFRPGHIVGPGWDPLNPAGHFNSEVFSKIARGEELVLPNFGLETVHHVHADDLARLIMAIIAGRSIAVGEAFNAVSRRRSTCVAMPKPCIAGSGTSQSCATCRSSSGKLARTRTRPTPPGSTSSAAPATQWTRPGACSTSSRAIPRWRRCRRP